MKKLLVLICLVIVVLTLVACGGKTATTAPVTTAAATTAPVTTAAATTAPMTHEPVTTTDNSLITDTPQTTSIVTTAETTAPVTTEEAVEIEPQVVSFCMQYSAFMNTAYDDNGRVVLRDFYHPHTMEKTGEYHFYSYDEDGKLVSLVIRDIYGNQIEHSFTLSEDGKTATANAFDENYNQSYVYSVYFDDGGKIVAEEKQTGGPNSYRFEYNETGRIASEILIEIDYEVVYRFNYRNNRAEISCLNFTDEGLVVTYNNVGQPISLEGVYKSSTLRGEFYSYFTYRKNLCVSARYFLRFEENVCDFTYDENDRLIKKVNLNKDTGYRGEWAYCYDAAGNRLKEEYKYFDENGSLNKWNVTEYTYDAKNRNTKKEYITYTPDGKVFYFSYEEYVYDDDGRLIEKTVFAAEKRVYKYTYFEDERYQVEESVYAPDLYYRWVAIMNGKNTEKATEYYYSLESGDVISKNEFEYTYDESGTLVQRDYKEFAADGKLLSREVTEYKNGKRAKITYYDANGDVIEVKEF